MCFADSHRAWVNANRETVQQHQRNRQLNATSRLKGIRTCAKRRRIPFAESDAEAMHAKLVQECHYCAYIPLAGETLNGLDRVDPALGYTDANTVTCCVTCNSMKGSFDIDVFINNIRRITVHHNAHDPEVRTCLPPAFGGRADLRAAPPKLKMDLLKTNDKLDLWCSSCYMCGRAPAFGIDRIDANGDYTLDNVKSCCSDCNYMKKDLDFQTFINHIAYINNHTRMWLVQDTARPAHDFLGKVRQPVAAMFGSKELVFPSLSTASVITGLAYTVLSQVVDSPHRTVRGATWRCVDVSRLLLQHVPKTEALHWLECLRGHK